MHFNSPNEEFKGFFVLDILEFFTTFYILFVDNNCQQPPMTQQILTT